MPAEDLGRALATQLVILPRWKWMKEGEPMAIFVVQQPYSQTNLTDKYRVTDVIELMRYVNGEASVYAYTEHDTYEDARQARDKANIKANPPMHADYPHEPGTLYDCPACEPMD